MRRRTVGWIPAAILLIAAGPPIRAGEPPPTPPAEALGFLRDYRLGTLAQRALKADRVLAPLKLEVKVRHGVAEVSGKVPSVDLGQQALAKVETIKGILEVRSKIVVTAVAAKPQVVEAAKPFGGSDANLVSGVKARAESAPDRPKEHPVPNKASGVRILPPQPREQSPRVATVSETRRKSLADQIAAVRKTQPRLRYIPVTIRGNDLIVHRRNVPPKDANDFSRALEGIPGVGDVLLGSD